MTHSPSETIQGYARQAATSMRLKRSGSDKWLLWQKLFEYLDVPLGSDITLLPFVHQPVDWQGAFLLEHTYHQYHTTPAYLTAIHNQH